MRGCETARRIVERDREAVGALAQELLDVARGGKVRVFVITIGGTSCAARPLESLTADTGGACYAEVPSGVGPRVTEIIED